jgi:hypothetical protein
VTSTVLQIDALGYGLRLCCRDTALAELVAWLFADLVVPELPDDSAELVVNVGPGTTTEDVLNSLVATVNFAAIDAARGQLLPHAGAVARGDGATALLCAPAGNGKSTLTAALVRRGLSYVTDETVSIDPLRMTIQQFRKPLSLKRGSHHLRPDLRPDRWPTSAKLWMVPAGSLGGSPLPTGPLTPELLVFPRFEEGTEVAVEPVEPGEAAYLVGRQCSSLGAVHDGPLPALARLVRRAPAYRLVHGDAEAAADAVENLWAS